jgi:hypothetical protein
LTGPHILRISTPEHLCTCRITLPITNLSYSITPLTTVALNAPKTSRTDFNKDYFRKF